MFSCITVGMLQRDNFDKQGTSFIKLLYKSLFKVLQFDCWHFKSWFHGNQLSLLHYSLGL